MKECRRTLLHWTPELGDREVWLEGLRSLGWVPEYPWEPTPITVNGRVIWPWVLIDAEPFERGRAFRQPDVTG